jgi:hypothetical protein
MPSLRRTFPAVAPLIVLLATLLLAAPAARAGGRGDINLTVGAKYPQEDFSETGTLQTALALTWGEEPWTVLPTAYIAHMKRSWRSDTEEDPGNATFLVSSTEYGLGLKKSWASRRLHAYLGLGALYGETKSESSGWLQRVEGAGIWSSAGAFVRVANRLNVGLELRYVFARALDDENHALWSVNEIEGWSVGGLIGWAWPASP